MKLKVPSRVIVILVSLAAFAPAAASSQILGLLTLERLSLLDMSGTGARPLALGGAYTAVSDDVYALLYNPAGLAWIEEKEISFGIHHNSLDVEQRYETRTGRSEVSATAFGHLALAYPYSEYRNSIVFAIGAFKTGSSDLEYVRTALRSDLEGSVTNSFIQSGSIYQYRFGAGIRLSPKISVGATLVLWDESVEFMESVAFEGEGDSTHVYIDDGEADLDGLSLEIGIMLHLSDNLRAGVTFSTPAILDWNGETEETYEGTYSDGAGWYTDPEYYYIEDEFTLPMRFSGGISFSTRYLLLCADFNYSDYSQTKYNGLALVNEIDRAKDILEPVFDFRFGAELRIPGTQILARGGYAWMPLRFQGYDELTYVVDTAERFGLNTEYDFYEIKEERQFFSFGIGGLIDEVLRLDLGVRFGSFERRSPFLAEKREVTEVAAGASYSF